MSKNALLEAPIASDRQAADSYHSSMDGNGQLRQAPAPHQWHQPNPAGPTQPYPPAPAPTSNRRWIPAAIISAGIIIAGAVVGGAVIMNHGNNADTSTAASSGPAAGSAAADGSTCKAWAAFHNTMSKVPPLPQGWDWNTPNIDTYIGNRARATEAALELFVPRITPEPADVAAAANDYVAAKRKEQQMLIERTYTGDVAATDAAFRLDQLCGQGS